MLSLRPFGDQMHCEMVHKPKEGNKTCTEASLIKNHLRFDQMKKTLTKCNSSYDLEKVGRVKDIREGGATERWGTTNIC